MHYDSLTIANTTGRLHLRVNLYSHNKFHLNAVAMLNSRPIIAKPHRKAVIMAFLARLQLQLSSPEHVLSCSKAAQNNHGRPLWWWEARNSCLCYKSKH